MAHSCLPAQSQEPTLGGCPKDSPETWDVTILLCPTFFPATCPPHSKANLLIPVVVKESTALIAGSSKECGRLMLKRPKLLDGFQGSGFKDNIWVQGLEDA